MQESKSDAAFLADRAELLLKQAARFNLKTRTQCLEHLGSHFRAALGSLPRKTDYQVGQACSPAAKQQHDTGLNPPQPFHLQATKMRARLQQAFSPTGLFQET